MKTSQSKNDGTAELEGRLIQSSRCTWDECMLKMSVVLDLSEPRPFMQNTWSIIQSSSSDQKACGFVCEGLT